MTLLAVASAVLAVWAAAVPANAARRLDGAVRTRRLPRRRDLGALAARPAGRALICVVTSAVVGWLMLGPVGLLIGIPVGLLVARWVARLETADSVRMRREIDRDLPLAADLLAACVAVGRSIEDSLPLVADAVGGALGARLSVIAARLELGADPGHEWTQCAADPHLAGLGRVVARSISSGAPLADGLSRLADDRRRERRTQAQQRARSVGVHAAGPLALCFLPAFMLIGVVPTVAGSVQHMFG